MFESRSKLQGDVRALVEALRELGQGYYAALFDPNGVLLESPDDTSGGEWILRKHVQANAEALFRLPAALRGSEEMTDLFEDFQDHEFFLAFLNGRVGVLVACPDAKGLEGASGKVLKVLADRLLRYNPAWRIDEKGRGLFFGSPRLDTVVIGRPSESG